jgi:hypothetical protein
MNKKICSILIISILIFSTIGMAISFSNDNIQTQHEDYTEVEFIPNNVSRFVTHNNTELILSIYVTPQLYYPIDTVSTDLITFPPNLLQCVDIEWGDLFETKTVTILGTIDNINGTITDMVWGSVTETEEPGYFANLTFEIISGGKGEVIIDSDECIVAYESISMPKQITHNTTLDFETIRFSNEYPVNTTVNHPISLQLEIDVEHGLDFPMDLYFKSNITGTWKDLDRLENIFTDRYVTSCYGVIDSPYNQKVQYQFIDYYSNIYHNNTCPTKYLGTINNVEIYTPSFSGTIKPIFGGLYPGENYAVSGETYSNITYDTYAPTVWTWDDVANLDLYTSSATTGYIIVTYDLGYGEGERIDWSVNATDDILWKNESYWYVTEIKSPVISNPVPYDVETWNFYYPTLFVDVYDPNGDTMNISFYWLNELDEWEQIGINQTGGNGTYYQPTSFNDYSRLYYWGVIADDGNGHTTEKYYRFWLRDLQDPPHNFIANKFCEGQINITWSIPEHVDTVRIQRRVDRYPTSISDGINVYNGSGTEYFDDAVYPGALYFYSAWSWNNTDKTWSEMEYCLEITAPTMITNFIVETVDYQTINLSWTKGENAETTIIRRKTGSYPSHPLDGILVYEGNGTSFTDTGLGGNITYYYRAWAQYWNIVDITSGSGTWTVPDDVTSVDVLVVGGGGGSGMGVYYSEIRNGGGGGAGGLIWMPFYPVNPNDNISYSIGSGGAGATWTGYKGSNGGNTVFGNLTALGGGGGGSMNNRLGADGGSGGGAGCNYLGEIFGGASLQNLQSGWSGIFGYGNNGANSIAAIAGGGGGAGGPGGLSHRTYGGIGINMSSSFGTNWGNNGIFASGGGAHNTGIDALANSGMGGRAPSTTSSASRPGGSGIILIRYNSQQIIDIGVLDVKTKFEEDIYDFYSCIPAENYTTTEVGPPTVFTQPATQIDDYVARLNGYLQADGGEATTVGFIWENESGTYNTTIGLKTNGETYYLDINGLEIGRIYSFNAWAKNNYGYVEGDELIFATRPQTPTNFTIFNVTYTSLELIWDVVDGADKSMIRMNTSSYPIDYYDSIEVAFTNENTFLVEDLLPNATYYFRIWSYNNTNNLFSNNYDEGNITTFVGPPVVTTLSVTNIQNETATLRGYLNDDRGEACTVGFRWGSSPGMYTNNVTVGMYSTGATVTLGIDSLSKGNTYYYQFWAKNKIELVPGDELIFSTRPVEPNSFIATRYGARQINLSWVNGQGADRVRILKKMDSYPNSTSDGLLVFFGTGTFYADVPLTENTTWYYSIWSYNNTNGLYSTDFDSNYAKTGFLPNITFMSPCAEINVERPPYLEGSAEGDYSHLTYSFYGFYGYAPKILGGRQSAGSYWANPHNVLTYEGTASYYQKRSKAYFASGWYYSSWLTINFDDAQGRPNPKIITGVFLNYTASRLQITFHNYDTNTWTTYTKDTNTKYWELPSSTNIDAIQIRFGNYAGSNTERVIISGSIDYVEFVMEPDFIYSNTVTSGSLDDCIWDTVIGSKNMSWMLEVYDGIDYLLKIDDVPTTYFNNLIGWCYFRTEGVEITDVSPYDGENNLMPLDARICSAQINHTAGATMNITFLYYDGENWQIGGQNLSVGNGTYQWIFPDCNENYKTYYWNLSVWDGLYYYNESYLFKTRPVPAPPNFNLMNYNATVVNITGISGDERTDIIMIRAKKGSYPSNREDGDLLFNASLTEYLHVGLDPNTYYYYRAWSYNITDEVWGSYTSKNIQTLGPQPPSFNLNKYNKSIINITGIVINDAYSDTILIKAKIGSYPTDRDDGIFVVNTSSSSYDHTDLIQTTHYYYRAWAYDVDTNWWSTPTDKNQKTNGPPTTSGFYPSNNQIISGVNPTLKVVVGEYNPTDTITVYFRTNASGTWTTISTQSALPKTFTYKTSQFFYQDYDYWWCANATDGEFWVNTTLKFTTGSMDVPTVTATTYNVSQINLSWIKANDTTHTWIQRKTDDYPSSRSDGINVYFGTGEYFEDIGLDTGELYCYRIWSYNSTTSSFSANTNTILNLTKPYGPINLTAEKTGHRSIKLSWEPGLGAEKTVIIYKQDRYPISIYDGEEIYRNNETSYTITGLKPDDYFNYYTPLPGTDNFGVYGDGDPFENSCDEDIDTKWDLNRATTSDFSYIMSLEPQRVKGFALLYRDFYEEPGTDWEAAITDFEIYNGTWHNIWNGKIINTETYPQWFYYESSGYYDDVTEVRFSAWTEWITPDIYEVLVGKLGYVHCFGAWSVVTKGGITQYSDNYQTIKNRTDDTPPNLVPEISNMNPLNESTGIDPNPTFNVTIADPEGLLMNITWQYLDGDDWKQFGFTSLVPNGTYYVSPTNIFTEFNTRYYWRVIVNDTADVGDSSIQTNSNISDVYWFETRDANYPSAPSDLNATAVGYFQINLTWTKGSTNYDETYIERNTSLSWIRGQGVFVYKGTNEFYPDTGLYDDTNYYYQAWGYNATDNVYSLTHIWDNATTPKSPNIAPEPPYDPSPSNNTDYIDVYNTYLNCTVYDANGDNMTATIYLSESPTGPWFIPPGQDINVPSGETASVYLPSVGGETPTWLQHDITYYWYAYAEDELVGTPSPLWNFNTCKAWDLNIDKKTNALDISLLVTNYGKTCLPGELPADVNNDGKIDALDLSMIITHYGETY